MCCYFHFQKPPFQLDGVANKGPPLFNMGVPCKRPGGVWRTGMAKKIPGVNPRYKNGNFRRKMRARFRAMDAPCSICGGRLGPIHYDEPSDSKHPLSFVIDEIRPVSRWREFGYDSPESACLDISNLAPAHWTCNAAKGNKVGFKKLKTEIATSFRW